MRPTALALILSTCSLWGAEETRFNPLPSLILPSEQLRAHSLPESLALRRLVDLIDSSDLLVAELQSDAFLIQFPKSEFKQIVLSWRLDIALCQQRYSDALQHFGQIEDPDLKARKLPAAMHSMYSLNRFDDLKQIAKTSLWQQAEKTLPNIDPLKFYLAEALSQSLGQEPDLVSLREATPLYNELGAGNYSAPSLQALAQIYCQLKEIDLANQYLERLQVIDPDHSKTLNFDAFDALIGCYDSLKRPEFYAKSIKAKDDDLRMLSYLALCFDLNRFDLVARDAHQWSQQLSEKARPYASFLLGYSLIELKDYKASIAPLKSYLDAQISDLPDLASRDRDRKIALLCLFEVASISRDSALFDMAIAQWQDNFPPSDELSQALFQRAHLQNADNPEKALQDLLQVQSACADLTLRKETLSAAIALAARQGDWKLCARLSQDLIQCDPKYSKIADLCPLMVRAVIEEQSAENFSADATELSIFQSFLSLKNQAPLLPAQLDQIYLELAEGLYNKGNQSQAIVWLKMVSSESNASLLSEELNADLADLKMGNFEREYVDAICQFLQDAQGYQTSERLAIYQMVFNKCIGQFTSGSLKDCSSIKALAAEALFLLCDLGEVPQAQNLIWLGDYYYAGVLKTPLPVPQSICSEGRIYPPEAFLPLIDDTETVQRQRAERAISIYSKALGEDKESLINSFENNANLEQSAFRCSKLLGMLSQRDRQLKLLSELCNFYHSKPDRNWPRKERAQFELALTADSLGESALAAVTYDRVLKSATADAQIQDWMSWRAALCDLKAAKSSPHGECSDSNARAQGLLKQLLQRRSVAGEPLYLEAALLAADQELTPLKQIESLENAKKLFAQTSNDIAEREYLAALDKMDFQKELFQNYIRWIDAKIANLKAGNNDQQAKAQADFAKTLFCYLMDKKSQSPLIAERATAICQKIEEEKAP